MEEKTKERCSRCGVVIENESDMVYVEGDVICQDCADNDTVVCDCCGERIYTSSAVSDDYISLCEDCYDSHYHRCASCYSIIHDDSTYWRNCQAYCESCSDEIDEYDEIEEYSYKPDPIFYGSGERYLGVELEIDNGGKDGSNALEIKELANYSSEHIYTKSDSSLSDGFEIVSHPMTLEYHMNSMRWSDVLDKARKLGYNSHQTETCGLHVHVNRSALGEYESRQEIVISRILFFVEKHWNEIFRFSRRTNDKINRWASRYGYEKSGRDILEKAKKGNMGRYTAVNLQNYSTIEFRVFKGTLKLNTFLATLQFVDTIVKTALTMTDEEMDHQSWSEFVQTIVHPELIQYLKERNLYINEKTSYSEEV